MTIAQLRIGENGAVRRIDGADECMIRLMEMGLTPGTTVELRGVAPLGDPLHLRLRGYSLSIRRVEAARIEIDPLASSR
jgi:ferrous iron transport protein A